MKHIGMAIVVNDGKILIARRKQGMKLGGFWEFPGGKVEAAESVPDCIRREYMEELGIRVTIGRFFGAFDYTYPEAGDFHFDVYWATCQDPKYTRMDAHDEVLWVTPAELEKYPFCEADISIIQKLKNMDISTICNSV